MGVVRTSGNNNDNDKIRIPFIEMKKDFIQYRSHRGIRELRKCVHDVHDNVRNI